MGWTEEVVIDCRIQEGVGELEYAIHDEPAEQAVLTGSACELPSVHAVRIGVDE
jgi:hypothetical protein